MRHVAIIGLGSWGLCALERLIDAARRSPFADLHVHVVEPGAPGGGLYSRSGPDYLILNTPCGQHSLYPYPDPVEGRRGMGFYEWVVERGYGWDGDECRISTSLRAISPHDFLPRRLMGEYLEWFYEMLVLDAPANVTIAHHRASAVDIEARVGGQERVHLDQGQTIDVHEVILTTGHTEYASDYEAHKLAIRPYPVERYVGSMAPGQRVAVEGMGLVALDVVSALTIGLGGRFEPARAGGLRYLPSGREPVLYMFSRTGYPYCAKSLGTADPVGGYHPAICTAEAVGWLRQRHRSGPGAAIDARRQLLPLVLAEMELRYYTHAAHLDQGPVAAQQVHDDLLGAWRAGAFALRKSAYAARYGAFSAADYIFVGEGANYDNSQAYESDVYGSVLKDVKEALVEGGASPVKAALETLRALRDVLRAAIDFKGLNLASYLDFQDNLKARLARPVTGPPVFRNQQLLALMDAGVVRFPFGPSPELVWGDRDWVRVRSTRLAEPCEMTFDHLVRAHIETPAIGRSTSRLLNNLARRGRLQPLVLEGTTVGSIDLSSEFHPISERGEERRLWVFGALTEGSRYFNLYIPSPKSRVRAFVDAEACANEILRRGGEPRARVPVDLRKSRTLRVALINNMADGAFEETGHQFRALLDGWPGLEVELCCYTLPGVSRGAKVSEVIAQGYGELAELWQFPPDAMIITGAEPKKAELTDELYWPALQELLWWGRSVVPNVVVSCLTAHAALWAFDGLTRQLLPEKCSGVFPQALDYEHPLMAGLEGLSLPHSRFNEVRASDLTRAGYRVLAESTGTGWTVALGDRGQCRLLLLQGHPEYGPLTLLREYRRDIRRYLSDEQGSYPRIPQGYLDAKGAAALERFQLEVTAVPRNPALMDGLPFEFAASRVSADWEAPARVFMGNWLQSVIDGALSIDGAVPKTTAAGQGAAAPAGGD